MLRWKNRLSHNRIFTALLRADSYFKDQVKLFRWCFRGWLTWDLYCLYTQFVPKASLLGKIVENPAFSVSAWDDKGDFLWWSNPATLNNSFGTCTLDYHYMTWFRADLEISKNTLLQNRVFYCTGQQLLLGRSQSSSLECSKCHPSYWKWSPRIWVRVTRGCCLPLGAIELQLAQTRALEVPWRSAGSWTISVGMSQAGWHLPSLLVRQTCQHAGHAAKGTGGLPWDGINKSVGVVGRSLLRVYLCGWSVRCRQSEFSMFFFAVPYFLISRRQTWVKHYV